MDAHRLGGNLVFANRHPGTAHARVGQPVAHQDTQQHQRQKQVVVHRDRTQFEAANGERFSHADAENAEGVNAAQPLGAVGNVDRMVKVVQEYPDDLAKAQRHDGQVVAAQFEGRRTQQDAKQPGHCGRQRKYQPQRRVQAVGEYRGDRGEGLREVRRRHQGIEIGADGEEGDIAEIQQAGVAYDDVQTDGQQHIKQGGIGNAHPGVAENLQAHRQQDQSQASGDAEKNLLVFHRLQLLRPGRPRVRPAGPTVAASGSRSER